MAHEGVLRALEQLDRRADLHDLLAKAEPLALVRPGDHLELEAVEDELLGAAEALEALVPLVYDELRTLVSRFGLCGAFALNSMVFTLPRYLGMEDDFAFARIFGLITLLSATFTILVGGSYFNYALRGDGQDAITPVGSERQLAAIDALQDLEFVSGLICIGGGRGVKPQLLDQLVTGVFTCNKC